MALTEGAAQAAPFVVGTGQWPQDMERRHLGGAWEGAECCQCGSVASCQCCQWPIVGVADSECAFHSRWTERFDFATLLLVETKES